MSNRKTKTSNRFENPVTKEFYQVEISGHTVTIQFGKIGTTGHRASREFTSNKQAEEFVIVRIRKKLEDGFREV